MITGYYIDLRNPLNSYINGNLVLHREEAKHDEIVTRFEDLTSQWREKRITQAEFDLLSSNLMTENMWDYFFLPIGGNTVSEIEAKEARKECRIINSHGKHTYYHGQFDDPRIKEVVRKYVVVKQFVRDDVAEFYDKHLEGHNVLGIHYRGSDKVMEGTVHPLSVFINEAEELIGKYAFDKIFLCSDVTEAVVAFRKHFGDMVVCTDTFRLGSGLEITYGMPFIHNPESPYRKGLSVLTDCLLLSRCDGFLRMENSNVSSFAHLFAERPFVVDRVAGRDVLPPSKMFPEVGACYIIQVDQHLSTADTAEESARSPMVLYENDVPLEGPHSIHEDIRILGRGRYSHWYSYLYFSTSDGSDPRINGRVYRFFCDQTGPSVGRKYRCHHGRTVCEDCNTGVTGFPPHCEIREMVSRESESPEHR